MPANWPRWPLTLAQRARSSHLGRPWAWPQQCNVCASWQGERVCPACVQRFAAPRTRCLRCAIDAPGLSTLLDLCGACLTAPPAFDFAVAAVNYGEPWSELITRFKFRQQPGLAPALVERLVDAARQHPQALQPPPDWLLPVPLAAERLRERGYNQAWELARRAARQLGLRADARLLLRTRHTGHQLGLDESARHANLRDAFVVEPLRRHEVRGRRVAVVDDVMTTGATAQELALTLKQAGAAQVQIWVVARTPKA